MYVCVYISLSLFLTPASYKRRSKQKEQGKKKKIKCFLTNPTMKPRLPFLSILLLQQPIIYPASVLILILSPSSLADPARHDQISNHLLSPRQDCGDSLFCGAPDVWGTLGGWLNGITNNESPAALPMPFDDGTTETLPPVPVPEGIPQQGQEQQQQQPPESQNPTLKLPGSQVEMVAPLTGTEECTAVLPQVNTEGWDAHANQDLQPCAKAIQRLIWPTSCSDTVQNQITEKIIGGMDPKFLLSIDSLCPGLKQGTVLFWMARLTEYQVDALKNEGLTSIKAIGDNVYSKSEGIIFESAQIKETITQKRSHDLGKRATWVALKRQKPEDVGLAFLSTSPGRITFDRGFYLYLAPAGAKVTVYVMSSGLDVQPSEISPGRVRWIYGLEAEETETDASDPVTERLGTCEAQKIGGESFGVAKNCDLVMVKIPDNGGAFIDALRLIIDDVVLRGIRAIGRSVIMTHACFKPLNDEAGRLLVAGMLPLINKLMNELQVVIVVTAGAKLEPYADIDAYPAAFAHVIDIITVGSVIAAQGGDNGKRYPFSPGGDALMVSGPGNGRCGGPGLGDSILNVVGHHVATAAVARLVAYFLSLPDLGKQLRRNKQTPKNVLDYLQLMSWKRYEAQESVWNGLSNSENRRKGYSNWIGVPPPK